MQLAAGGSVPGRVLQRAGGVGRNIAGALATLQSDVRDRLPYLVSVVGDDATGRRLVEDLRHAGCVDVGGC